MMLSGTFLMGLPSKMETPDGLSQGPHTVHYTHTVHLPSVHY